MYFRNIKKITQLVAVFALLMLAGLACSPAAQPAEPEVIIEEPEVVVEPEPEDEPEFKPERVLQLELGETVYSLTFSNAGDVFATSIFPQVDVWNASDGEHQRTIELTHRAMGVAFSPDDQMVYVALGVGGVNLYNLADVEMLIDFHGGMDNYLTLSPDGTKLATGNRSSETWLWDASSGDLVHEINPANHIDGYSEWLTALTYSPDGSIIAAGHWDGHVFLWDANNGDLILTIEPETEFCNAKGLAFSSDGEYLAVGGLRHEMNEAIKVFQVSDGSLAWTLEEYSRSGTREAPVAYSPDGMLFAAGASDGIYIWALPDYELLHTLPIEATDAVDWVTGLAFSPDSQKLLAGHWNNYVNLWQVQE